LKRILLCATTTAQRASTHHACEQQSDARRLRDFTDSGGRDWRSSEHWCGCGWSGGSWRSSGSGWRWSLELHGCGRCADYFTLDGPAGQGACVRTDAFSLGCAGGDEQGGDNEVTNLHGGSFFMR